MTTCPSCSGQPSVPGYECSGCGGSGKISSANVLGPGKGIKRDLGQPSPVSRLFNDRRSQVGVGYGTTRQSTQELRSKVK